jgi:4-amino-4-deoxy-L-arabinose transferase-like glycosyltransferase
MATASAPPTPRPSAPEPWLGPRAEWALVAGLLAAALAVRLPGLLTGFWHDEVMYSWVYFDDPARRSWLLWRDVHPPVYPLLLWLWSSLFGNQEAVLRLPSLLCGLGSLVLSWRLARRCFGPAVALLATAFLTFSPPHVWYSVENKANMLVLFLSVLAAWLAVRAVEQPGSWRRWAATVVALLLALGTHSYALAIAGAVLTWLVWRAWRDRRLRIPAAVASVVSLGAWLPLFVWKIRSQGGALARPYLRSFDAAEAYQLLLVWLPHGNSLRRLDPYRPLRQILEQPWPWFLVDGAGAFLLVLGLAAALRQARHGPATSVGEPGPWPSRLLLLWLVPPILVAALASLVVQHFYIERNLFLLLPAYAMVAALGTVRLRPSWARATAGGALVALALAGCIALLGPRRAQWTVYKPKPDWRAAAAWLAKDGVRQGRLSIVTTTPSLETEFYLPARPGRPPATVTDWCRARIAPLYAARQAGGSFWLVKNETWTGCWEDVWRLSSRTPQVTQRSERHFAGLTLHEIAERR